MKEDFAFRNNKPEDYNYRPFYKEAEEIKVDV